MQDLLALAAAFLAAAWLARRFASRMLAPPCRPPIPGGGDGFVPLESLSVQPRAVPMGRAQEKPGRPKGRPGMVADASCPGRSGCAGPVRNAPDQYMS
jgi:hypothetical protein